LDAAAVAMNRFSSYSKKTTYQAFYVKNNQLETFSSLHDEEQPEIAKLFRMLDSLILYFSYC
jgi:hypothetical protein